MAPFLCSICARKFKTRPLIFAHALETGHSVNQCCRTCLRWFESQTGLTDHANSVHKKAVNRLQSTDSRETPTNASPIAQLKFGDVIYTNLERQQQTAVFNQLSAYCHSAESLENEGYILDIEKESATKRKKPRPSLADFQQTPPMQFAVTKRRAIVIDCEMAETFDGSDELISLCAIDFLTGDTLIDSFVHPSRHITDWRTKIHGIDAAVIAEAAKDQPVLHGWAAARAELWKHIDENTILIGQTVLFDFEALRLIHTRVVDSAMLATEAVFNNKKKTNRKPRRRWELHELCETFLGIQIRSGDGIHSGMEDVLAAREVVLQYLLRPNDFKKWADKAREDFWKPKAGSKNSKKKKPKERDDKGTAPQSAEQTVPVLTPLDEYEGYFDSHDDDDFCYHDFSEDEIFEQERDWFIKFGI